LRTYWFTAIIGLVYQHRIRGNIKIKAFKLRSNQIYHTAMELLIFH